MQNNRNIERIKLQELILLIRNNGFIKEANLLEKISNEVRYGKIVLVTHAGRINRIEREVEYDDLSDGL